MSTTNEEIRVKILDAKKAETELRKVRKELEDTTGSTEKHTKASKKEAEHVSLLSRAGSGLKNALGYGVGILGLAGVGYGLKDVVEGGIAAQEQQALLQNALRDTGQAGGRHMGELHKAIARTSTHGGFSALEETEGLSQFIRETKSATGAIKLNREAIDLARGAHMSYSQALTTTERLQTGQVGRLQKYLGIIQPVKYYVDQLTAAEKKRNPELLKHAELLDKEATAQEANRRVLKRYGAAVASYNNQTAGAISNTKNTIKLLEEELGEKLAPTIAEVAKGLSSLLIEIEEGKGTWGTLGEDASAVAHDLKDVWEWIEKSKTAVTALEVGLGFLATAWAVEKVIEFYNAIKKLTLVNAITSGIRGLTGAETAAAGAGEAEGAVAGEVGGASLVGPELAAAGAFLFIAKELHLFGENLGETRTMDRHAREGSKYYTKAHGEGLLGHALLEKPDQVTAARVKELSQFNRNWLAKELAKEAAHPNESFNLKPGESESHLAERVLRAAETAARTAGKPQLVVNLDGKKIAEIAAEHAINNPQVARKYGEAVTKHTQVQKARGR